MPETQHAPGEAGNGATSLLHTITRPGDIKRFSEEELAELAKEMRQKIIATAAANGGHLAPHLGVVELAIALHYVFDTERDKVIWDVGHQCYPHKLLTGRADRFTTVRKKNGLSGYPKVSESPYDAFGTGHSSTSISAALGMAVAAQRKGEDRRIVAVIGDGAMTAGEAFEALAHAGHLGLDLIVVLNDNEMSISKNVGAMSAYFSRLITGGLYTRARHDINELAKQILGPRIANAAKRVEHSVKGLVTPGTMFEELGLKYVGPVDGHDIGTLLDCFGNLKKIRGPVFFHCVTKKGKGYNYAEADPCTYHGVKAFDIATGKFISTPCATPTQSFTDAFAEALIEAAEKDERVVAITAAMPTGTGLDKLAQQYPDRVFDVGICEQHAVTFSAGLAISGMKPVAAIYSTFLQRGYDQYIHDVCLQDLPVVFAVDRAGPVGEDSPTQQGAFDLSFLRIIPNITVLAPRDAVDLKAMLHWALAQNGPVAIRYARAMAPTIGQALGRDIARGQMLRDGTDLTVLGLGPCLRNCLEAAELLSGEGLSVAVADARSVKPLDTDLLDAIAGTPILTVEENTLCGGFGSAVLEYYQSRGILHQTLVKSIGFPDAFIGHATREEQIQEIGLYTKGIASAVRALVAGRAKAETLVKTLAR